MDKMMEILGARKGSWASLDGMRERYNVFAQFLPSEAIEKETAAEAEDDDEPPLMAAL
jgi:hypothetical protein